MDDTKANIFWDRIAERAEETILALKENRSPKIIRYALHMTSKCNMDCKYCREVRGHTNMPRALFIKLCHQAGKNGIIHITGGEPLSVPYLEEEIYNYKDITRFALNSNLLIMPKDQTLRSIFRCKTSLDDYDEKRWNELTGGNFFKIVVSHIKQVIEIVRYTSICYTATHQNADRLFDFIQFCYSEFPKLFSISVSFYKGEDNNLNLTQEDINKLYNASRYMDEISRQLFLETHTRQGNYYPDNIKIPCYLSLTERLFDEYGYEYYCSHLYRDKVSPPGNPGKDQHCITGCNARFNKFNQLIHQELQNHTR